MDWNFGSCGLLVVACKYVNSTESTQVHSTTHKGSEALSHSAGVTLCRPHYYSGHWIDQTSFETRHSLIPCDFFLFSLLVELQNCSPAWQVKSKNCSCVRVKWLALFVLNLLLPQDWEILLFSAVVRVWQKEKQDKYPLESPLLKINLKVHKKIAIQWETFHIVYIRHVFEDNFRKNAHQDLWSGLGQISSPSNSSALTLGEIRPRRVEWVLWRITLERWRITCAIIRRLYWSSLYLPFQLWRWLLYLFECLESPISMSF